MERLVVVVLLVCALQVVQPLREDVNFNFGWRFSIGHKIQCGTDAFTQKLDGVQCSGLLPIKNKLATQDECRDACCEDVLCAAWQYKDKSGCYLGENVDTSNCSSKTGENWTGEWRKIPASLPPAGDGPGSQDFDDSSWNIVDLPYDGIINGTFDENNLETHGYLPLNTTWYRKHFSLPAEWKGQSVWFYFEGVFRASVVYVNGNPIYYHDSGYTSFTVRLDNISSITYGASKENVISVKSSSGGAFSGHWYEGGGIYRPVHLVSTDPVHFVADGVYGASKVVGSISDHDSKDPTSGQYADVEFNPVAEVVNTQTSAVDIMVKFDVYDDKGKMVATTTSKSVSIESGKTVLVNTTIPKTSNIELWSIARPCLYKLEAWLLTAPSKPPIDNVTCTIGARLAQWDPDTGFSLNGKHFEWRGFNNHNDFTGVGAAVPDRVNLFRGQMMRAVGANSWRMSHNPPVPAMLDVLDNIGIVVWDENRLMGNNTHWIQNQMDMVRRDRNHPSVMIWSFCNEGECTFGYDKAVAELFKDVSKAADPYRPVSANMIVDNGNDLSKVIDVQGLSHRGGSVFDSYHKTFPDKPLLGSECCSCRTQRGEDIGGFKIFGSFNADCNQDQTERELDRPFVAGCMVWTLFDYYGEPTPFGWPHVVGSFGSIDVAGFPKPSAYWYRTWWYYSSMRNTSDGGYDVPVNPPPLPDPYATASQENSKEGVMVYIVGGWEELDGLKNRTVYAYTNAPMAELMVNGKSQGVVKVDWLKWAEWKGVAFSSGKIVVTALDSDNTVKATHTVQTAGSPVKVVAAVDVPSEKTGTGTSLVLDGQDAGMISVAIVDSSGNVVPSYSGNVTFRVVSGPGRIIGVGNGNPACHEPNQVSQRSTYHGLARAIVQTTVHASSSQLHRKRLMQIDRDGGLRTYVVPPGHVAPEADEIVVEASIEGLGKSTVSIPVSSDSDAHGVLAAAKNSMNLK